MSNGFFHGSTHVTRQAARAQVATAQLPHRLNVNERYVTAHLMGEIYCSLGLFIGVANALMVFRIVLDHVFWELSIANGANAKCSCVSF